MYLLRYPRPELHGQGQRPHAPVGPHVGARKLRVGHLGWRYASNATCLTLPHLLYVRFRRVKDHDLLPYSPRLKKSRVRQVVLDKRFPLATARRLFALMSHDGCSLIILRSNTVIIIIDNNNNNNNKDNNNNNTNNTNNNNNTNNTSNTNTNNTNNSSNSNPSPALAQRRIGRRAEKRAYQI